MGLDFLKQIQSEFRRTVLNDSVTIFYFFSMIVWPIISLIQIFYNISIFSIKDVRVLHISNEKQLLYFIFIGYCAFVLFENAVQSSWRLGSERYLGTLSQIFIAPINKTMWAYTRTLSLIFSNSWFFITVFILGNLFYIQLSLKSLVFVLLASLLMIFSTWIWGTLISSLCIILRDGTIVFILLNGPQGAFSGSKVPLSISPKIVRIIGSFFPVSYTIIYLREILLNQHLFGYTGLIFLAVNAFIVILTMLVLYFGERHMRQTGSYDLF